MSFGGFGGFGEDESQDVMTGIGKTPTVCTTKRIRMLIVILESDTWKYPIGGQARA